jgi:hypothetical protein
MCIKVPSRPQSFVKPPIQVLLRRSNSDTKLHKLPMIPQTPKIRMPSMGIPNNLIFCGRDQAPTGQNPNGPFQDDLNFTPDALEPTERFTTNEGSCSQKRLLKSVLSNEQSQLKLTSHHHSSSNPTMPRYKFGDSKSNKTSAVDTVQLKNNYPEKLIANIGTLPEISHPTFWDQFLQQNQSPHPKTDINSRNCRFNEIPNKNHIHKYHTNVRDICNHKAAICQTEDQRHRQFSKKSVIDHLLNEEVPGKSFEISHQRFRNFLTKLQKDDHMLEDLAEQGFGNAEI